MRYLGGPEEYRRVNCRQRCKGNSRRESGHSHQCIAPSPPISLHSEDVPRTKFDRRDIYGVYPNNFGNMSAEDDTTN